MREDNACSFATLGTIVQSHTRENLSQFFDVAPYSRKLTFISNAMPQRNDTTEVHANSLHQ